MQINLKPLIWLSINVEYLWIVQLIKSIINIAPKKYVLHKFAKLKLLFTFSDCRVRNKLVLTASYQSCNCLKFNYEFDFEFEFVSNYLSLVYRRRFGRGVIINASLSHGLCKFRYLIMPNYVDSTRYKIQGEHIF